MCGISGVIGNGSDIDLSQYYIAHSCLRHRGPDDEGFVVFGDDGSGHRLSGDGTCAELKSTTSHISSVSASKSVLGHHRLSIIDISSAGHQPMHHDGLWMVYNGEVYNYRELRDELEQTGYRFSSATDSEVVLKAYHHWGAGAFNRFNGMWALAIWNERSNSLLLSRDRFGVKPLYYAHSQDRLYFASETKFFRAIIDVVPHEARMQEYISSCLLDHGSETMLSPVKQLLPAHYAEFKPDGNSFREFRYWSLPDDSMRLTENEAIDQFNALFDSAVDLRLRSDVPLGGLLSGGLDSSAIVSNLAHRGLISAQGLLVFSAVFPDWDESEHELIEETIRKYPQIKSHHVVPTSERLMEDLPRLLYQVDFPIRSHSVHSQSMLYEKIREESNIVVLLNGQGADEIFAGYQGQRLPRIASALQRLRLADAWNESRALAQLRGSSSIEVLMASAKTWLRHLRDRYFSRRPGAVAASMNGNPFAALLAYNLTYASLPEYLRYEDRNSMRASCETRLPFLDYRLVEWAFRLDDDLKIRNGETKFVQRRAIAAYVPEQIVASRVKKGFVSPQQDWQRGPMKEWLEDRVANHGICFIAPDLIDTYQRDPETNYSELWRIACLAEWLNVQKSTFSVDRI